MQRKSKKMTIGRQTLRTLSAEAMSAVAGGGYTDVAWRCTSAENQGSGCATCGACPDN